MAPFGVGRRRRPARVPPHRHGDPLRRRRRPAGPGPAWFRLQRPVVGDEEPTGVQRAAAAADFGNGISWVLPFEDWIFLNPDLTLHLARRRPASGSAWTP